eukprot:3494446-Prorocentrum_lima.AAC.1
MILDAVAHNEVGLARRQPCPRYGRSLRDRRCSLYISGDSTRQTSHNAIASPLGPVTTSESI